MPELAFRISPRNLISDFGDFESWSKGTSVAPDGWTATGTAGSIARESGASNIKFGTYSMKITAGSSGVYAAEYLLDLPTRTVFNNGVEVSAFNYFPGRTIKFGCWVKCSTASKARIYINDGVASRVNSSYHTGGGDWEFLEVEHQIDTGAIQVKLGCESTNNAIVAYFDGAVLVEGENIWTEFRDDQIWVREEEFDSQVSFSVGSFIVPRRHGTRIPEVYARNRTVRIKVQIWQTTFSAARTIFDTIVKAVSGGEKELLFEDDRVCRVLLSNFPRLDRLAAGRVYTFDLQFTAEEAFLYYLTKFRQKNAISSSPTSFQIESAGSIFTLPRFYFLPPTGVTFSTGTLENLTTGERFTYAASVSPGFTVMVDCFEQKVLRNNVDGLSDMTGDFLKLVPGTNYMKFTGTAGISVLTDWYERFL